MADNLSLVLLRPDDLLALQFEFVNLALDATQSPPVLTRIQPGQPALIIVAFAPQQIGEHAFPDPQPGVPPMSPPPIGSVLAEPTRLAFRLPDTQQSLPFTVASLLNWVPWVPSLGINALTTPPASNPPGLAPPTPQQTAIEVPYRLVLSPDANAGWIHAIGPVTRNGRTELWRTRLGYFAGGRFDATRAPLLRAIWLRDFTAAEADQVSALSTQNRLDVAHLSGDFTLPLSADPAAPLYAPVPLDTSHLVLSALGAWADISGQWDIPALNPGFLNISLEAWHQVVSAGRDQYVRVITHGTLCPFGHRAAMVAITERKLATRGDGKFAEYLLTRTVLLITEPVRRFDDPASTAAYPKGGREMPFRSVRVTTTVTPQLDPLSAGQVPSAAGVPFEFHCVTTDWDGQSADFAVSMLFVDATMAGGDIAGMYSAANLNRSPDLRRQTVAFAPSNTPGDTHFGTNSVTFTVQGGLPLDPPYLPILASASVSASAVDRLLGSSGGNGGTTFEYHPLYLAKGFDASANPSEVLARFTALAPLALPTEKAGVATPTLTLDGVSRSLGTIPVDAVTQQSVQGLINSLDGHLLGSITLKDVISAVTDGSAPFATQLPKLVSVQAPSGLQTSFTWSPAVARINDPNDAGTARPALPIVTTADTRLVISATASATFDGAGAPSFIAEGSLSTFALNLFDIVVVTFDQIRFHSEPGKKLDLTTQNVHVEFVGALGFVNQLAELMPPQGFSDPPSILVSPDGITAGYTLGIPNAGVGAFSLENISLSAALELPFNGNPVALRIAFSERFHPFLVTLWAVGGGGFLAVEVTTSGIESIEGSLELGGNITVSLAIIEANAHVMIGVHFGIRLDSNRNPQLDFCAYIRVGASVDLLGIVGVSIDIYVGLGFIPKFFLPPAEQPGVLGVVSGVASVTVGVHLLFIDKTFNLTFERRFTVPAGVNVPLLGSLALPILKDPSFDEMVSVSDWQNYCQAFA